MEEIILRSVPTNFNKVTINFRSRFLIKRLAFEHFWKLDFDKLSRSIIDNFENNILKSKTFTFRTDIKKENIFNDHSDKEYIDCFILYLIILQ